MEIGYIVHSSSSNIGDFIQSYIIKRFIEINKFKPLKIERDNLRNKTPKIAIINGWFSHKPYLSFPLSFEKYLVIGIHLDKSAYKSFSKTQKSLWSGSEFPIGCRDEETFNFIKKENLKASLSFCPTMLLNVVNQFNFQNKQNLSEPNNKRILCVDFNPRLLPRSISQDHEIVNSTAIFPPYIRNDFKDSLTLDYIKFLSNWEGLICTTRLHVALPSLSMGKSVLFFGDINNSRLTILKKLGIEVNSYPTNFGNTKNISKFFKYGSLILNNKILNKYQITNGQTEQFKQVSGSMNDTISDFFKNLKKYS